MRYRWLDALSPFSLRSMASKIKQMPYTTERASGFVLDRARDSQLDAVFYERSYYTETLTDPFGSEQSFERETYKATSFSLYSDSPTLELRDSPRSILLFSSAIQELTDYRIAISPLTIDPGRWLAELEKIVAASWIVDAIHLSQIDLGSSIFAKIVVSGEKDVREAARNLVSRRKFSADKVAIRIEEHCGSSSKVLLSRAGCADVKGVGSPELSSALRLSLRSSL